MFKNREIRVQLHKTNNNSTTVETVNAYPLETIPEIIKQSAKYIAIATGGVIAAVIALDTARQITVNKTSQK